MYFTSLGRSCYRHAVMKLLGCKRVHVEAGVVLSRGKLPFLSHYQSYQWYEARYSSFVLKVPLNINLQPTVWPRHTTQYT